MYKNLDMQLLADGSKNLTVGADPLGGQLQALGFQVMAGFQLCAGLPR
jgi:hypothetical protein